MTEIEQHIQTLSVMQAQYSHIRRCEFEWQAIEAAKDALREKQEPRKAAAGAARAIRAMSIIVVRLKARNGQILAITMFIGGHIAPCVAAR